MLIKHAKTNIEGISYTWTESEIIIRSTLDLHGLSNAALNGGNLITREIVNNYVPKSYTLEEFNSTFDNLQKRHNLSDNSVVFLTAVKMKNAAIEKVSLGPIEMLLIVTAGTTNAASPQDGMNNYFSLQEDLRNHEYNPKHNTINTIVIFDCDFPPHLYSNLFILLTEAKTVVLREGKISTQEGHCATGTTTDAIGVFTTGRLHKVNWSGLSTEFGKLVSKAYMRNLKLSLIKGGYIDDS
ncbi:hypothetical protein NEF87_004872 [Candidatus Lokiarchaeum ossiferum]|uniref:Adenosylcobinamide amidohydrolase n=1 Tax=Candidatus Lokiarchaeum ossiferum TaxID=2951803 RepID=A0ABY6HYI9_9ARCH|nr:hypothetical protein NEF87_004872 [Candidatus Lokiarchaeum sp. B-35]